MSFIGAAAKGSLTPTRLYVLVTKLSLGTLLYPLS